MNPLVAAVRQSGHDDMLSITIAVWLYVHRVQGDQGVSSWTLMLKNEYIVR